MQKQLYFTSALLLCSFLLHATHNKSGEITFRKTGGLTVEATITTWTKTSSVNADRDTLEINWGDGLIQKVARSNNGGQGQPLANDIKYNVYIAVHTYAVPLTYRISMTDLNRTGNIINVNPPASDNIPFHLEATVRLQPDAATSQNSPVFLEHPVDVAYTFVPFSHVVNAFDPDGDSLAFELVVPMAGAGMNVPNYSFPDQIAPSDDNKIFLNPVTGEFFWDTPIVPGVYCIAILVKAYRNGLLVETTRRDMLIEVYNQTNYPPEIALIPFIDSQQVISVNVGQTVQITVNATDPDMGQMLTLSASGGPFEDYFQEKAAFSATGASGLFTWHVTPEYLRTQPYQFVFKAKDDYLGNGLAATKVVRFRVIAASGVEEQTSSVNALNVSPNPTSGAVNIQLPESLSAPATLRLFDFYGKLLSTESMEAGSRACSIDLGNRPSGLYFIEIQTIDKKIMQGKVIR